MMTPSEKKIVLERYSQRYLRYGDSPLTLGWTKGKHFLRYHILLSHWKFTGESLLDFGCGFGDMYHYIQEKKLDLHYHGYDINSDLINRGNIKYPGIQLSTDDIFAISQPKSFDYALSSGVHNLKLTDNWAFIKQTFDQFAFLCRKGFALNFVSNKVTISDEHLYHADPVQILDLAYTYSKKVVLRNDYMPFEFTVIVDLDDTFDIDTVVYPEYLSHIKLE